METIHALIYHNIFINAISCGLKLMDKAEEYRIQFGKALRNLRKLYTGKSLRMFAYEYDIPCATLSRIENGQREAQLTTLKRISEGFGWSFEEFIKNIETKMPNKITLKDE